MFKIFCFFLTLGTSSCDGFKRINPSKDPMALEQKLELARAKRDFYCDIAKLNVQEKGFAVSECDGLLFSSLHNIACVYPDLAPFESKENPGQWFRNPNHDCFNSETNTDNGSNSDSSKDMVQGWGLNKIHNKDFKELKEFLDYASANNNYFCKAIDTQSSVSQCLLPPTTAKIFEDAISGHGLTAAVTQQDGFLGHLEVLGVLIGGSVYGKISDLDLEKLQYHAERQPRNALYQAAYHLYKDGDMNGAADILLDANQWPTDRLTNSRDDYCTDYKYQRDDKPKDWAPCPDEKIRIHDGTDFVFAVAVMLGEVK